MNEKINTHLANDLEQSAAMLDSREFDAVQLDNCASMMRYAATVIRQALEQPAPAQEPVIQDWMKPDALCDRSCLYACTEGFTKFPTCVPLTAPAQEPDPDELAIAYMSGLHEGKKIGAKEGRNKLATWMMQCGFATGHGDTLEELLYELDTEIEDRLAAKKWVGLTDEDIVSLLPITGHRPATTFARAIEAKLKERNT